MVVNTIAPVTIDPAGPYCSNDDAELMAVSEPNGVWSGDGITDPATGSFDPSAAGPGTHTITYTPAPGCSSPNSMDIVVNPVPVADFDGMDLEGCVPLEATIWALNMPANSNIVWDFGDGTVSSENDTMTHTYTVAGDYTVMLTITAGGCSNSLTQSAYVNVTPGADPGFDIVPGAVATVTDPTFVFINDSDNANTYVWTFGDDSGSTEEHPTHTYPQEPGSYTVTLTASTNGECAASVTKNVTIREDLIFYVPNAFTPDGDEYNNVFQPVFHSGYDAYSFTMFIFDRWGEVLFETHDVNKGWDGTYNGKQAKEGVYTWAISFKLYGTDEKAEYNGSVTKIR
jgi:trimeric autotransporter adhesin